MISNKTKIEILNEAPDYSSSYESVVGILKNLHSFSDKIQFKIQDVNGYYNIVYDDPKQITKNALTALKDRKFWNTEFVPTTGNFANSRVNIHFEKPAQQILNIKDFDKKNWTPGKSKENANDELEDELFEGQFCSACLAEYITERWEKPIEEAEYRGRKVQLGKPFLTPDGPKKRSVYVKNAKGNVVKVNFGQKGVAIKKHLPKHRKSYRARHNCKNPGPRWKANYWSCRAW